MAESEAGAPEGRPRRILVLQGGGALGAYQGGVFEGLSRQGVAPDWIAGISIGAVNAALIAGNPPERRIERLREFWTRVTDGPQAPPWDVLGAAFAGAPAARGLASRMNAAGALVFGVNGFFSPRFPPPQLQPPGGPAALSFYDTAPLRGTLERLVDFDRINDGPVRLSVGAVDIETGNFVYFDTASQRLGPEHIMASGALPPGLPPIRIDGRWYWDGGLVSNTPLEYVLETASGDDQLIFQVDLFPARGPMPRNLDEAAEREMDIRFSSRTRLNTDQAMRLHDLKRLARRLIGELPAEIARSEAARQLAEFSDEGAVSVVHLIYRGKPYESRAKDFEFSRPTMTEHWACGLAAVERAFADGAAMMAPSPEAGFQTYDEGERGLTAPP